MNITDIKTRAIRLGINAAKNRIDNPLLDSQMVALIAREKIGSESRDKLLKHWYDGFLYSLAVAA